MPESEDFDWETWNNEGQLPCSENREIIPKRLVKQLAYHEASHFVFCILAERLKIGFKPVLSIEIHPENKIEENAAPNGLVYGFGSPYGDETPQAKEKTKKWYLENSKRYFSSIFQTIAGHTSYQVFIEDVEHFIGIPDYLNYVNTVPFYRLDCLPNDSDLEKIQEKLEWKGITTVEEKVRVLILLRNEVKQVEEVPIVNQSIRFVANRLIKAKGRKIERKELASIRDKVNVMTKRASIIPYLTKYENSI